MQRLTLTIWCGSVNGSTDTGLKISEEGRVLLHDAGVGKDAMLSREWRLL